MAYEQFICAVGFESVELAREFHAGFVKSFCTDETMDCAQFLPPIKLIDAGEMYDNAGILYFEDNNFSLNEGYKKMMDRFMDDAMAFHPEVFGRHTWVDEDQSVGDQEFIPRDDADWPTWAMALNDIFTRRIDANVCVGNGSQHEVEVWHNGKCIGVRESDWVAIPAMDGGADNHARNVQGGEVTLKVADDGYGLWSAFCDSNVTHLSLTIKQGMASKHEAMHAADITWAWRKSWESMVQLAETAVPR